MAGAYDGEDGTAAAEDVDEELAELGRGLVGVREKY